MENLLKELETLSAKKSKLSGVGKKRAAEILTTVYEGDGDIKRLCQELITLPVGVQAEFFASNYANFEKGDKLKLLVDTIVSDKTFIKNDRNEPVKRTIEIIDIYLKKGNFDASVCVLFNATLKVAFKKNKVNSSFVTLFSTKIIGGSGYEFLQLKFVNDETFYMFLLLDELIKTNVLDADASELKGWELCEQFEKGEHKLVVAIKPIKPKRTVSTTELENSITSLQAMADKITQSLHEEYGTIESLKRKVQEQNAIIESLTNNASVTSISSDKPTVSNDDEVDELLARVIELDDELKAEKLKSKDLDERLTLAFNMDESTISQEIITLKNDIGQSLRIEHNNFQENINVECGEDMFIAYRATITRIFRTLKRFGVEFE